MSRTPRFGTAPLDEAAESAQQDGVTVLVNGCSAVEVVVEQFSVCVIDPTALALRVADFAAREYFLSRVEIASSLTEHSFAET